MVWVQLEYNDYDSSDWLIGIIMTAVIGLLFIVYYQQGIGILLVYLCNVHLIRYNVLV